MNVDIKGEIPFESIQARIEDGCIVLEFFHDGKAMWQAHSRRELQPGQVFSINNVKGTVPYTLSNV